MAEPRPPKQDRLRRGPEPERDIAARTRTLVIGPYLARVAGAGRAGAVQSPPPNPRPMEARLDEAVGLARAIDLDVVGQFIVVVSAPRPSTLLGKGKVEEIAGRIAADEVDLVVMDGALTPVQQRNLEKAWGAKVIDRTGLILEIFGRRARTREGALQVEHAHLAYQKSRLVRSWTHLERQRGGFGFLGGPGETQIEADRRIIQDRMRRIERDLDAVKQTRSLHRASRRRVPYPIVALVGYTNAGKSTLFNRLTSAEVFAENLLFATLDPTSRAIKLPHGETAILSDTVGFISDLPTMLVAAFRATLEDVIEADVLLHVRDISHGETEAEAADVQNVLRQLGINPDDRARVIEVWNKADLLAADERDRLAAVVERAEPETRPALVSAVTGEGIDALLAGIEARIAKGRPSFRIAVEPSDGGASNWLHEEAEIIERLDGEGGRTELTVRIAPEKEPRLRKRFPQAERLT
ncbi:GTPase HflX [Enterovirga aerilata]|uniref:GTPase HflX n=1 Tax=Enterovirga aerilata TaxID=2730920 RepID=A0A849I702_9HYPH|nr:GTPase HflX [Enterovirga sp. DB1703]